MRAAWINTLPQPGNFESLEEYNIQNGNILDYLILVWRRFIVVLRNTIMRNPRTPLSQKELIFVKERVKIRSQSYCTLDISFFLILFFWKIFHQAEGS